MGEWLNQLWHNHNMEYYLALKKELMAGLPQRESNEYFGFPIAYESCVYTTL